MSWGAPLFDFLKFRKSNSRAVEAAIDSQVRAIEYRPVVIRVAFGYQDRKGISDDRISYPGVFSRRIHLVKAGVFVCKSRFITYTYASLSRKINDFGAMK